MAGPLETLYLLFKVDTSEVKKGTDEAKKSVDKFQESLKKVKDPIEELGSKFTSLVEEWGKALLSFVSVDTFLEGLKHAQQYAESLYQIGRELHTNTEELDAWGTAVAKNGGTIESFQSTLRGLDRDLAGLSLNFNSNIIASLAQLGIRATDAQGKIKSSLSLLPEIAKAFEILNPQTSKAVGLRLGLDIGTIQLLQKGQKAVENFIVEQKRLGVTTQQTSEIANNFNQEWLNIEQAFRKLFENVNDKILPGLTEFLKISKEIVIFFQSHSDILIGTVVGVAGALTYLLIPAIKLVTAIAFPWLRLITILGALGTAIGFVYSEIKAFISGNKTVTEGFLDWAIGVKNVEKLKTSLKEVHIILSEISNAIHEIVAMFVKAGESIKSFFGIKNESTLGNIFSENKDTEKNPKKEIDNLFSIFSGSKSIESGKQAILQSSNLPIALQNSNSLLNTYNPIANHKNTTIDVGSITIQTQASNPEEIASTFRENLIDQLRLAINQHNDAVVA